MLENVQHQMGRLLFPFFLYLCADIVLAVDK